MPPNRFQMETISSTNKCGSRLVHSGPGSLILVLIKLSVQSALGIALVVCLTEGWYIWCALAMHTTVVNQGSYLICYGYARMHPSERHSRAQSLAFRRSIDLMN